MNIEEMKVVLAKVQLGDNRQVDKATLMEWFDTAGFLNGPDALEAVRMHRRESTDYLMPAHLIRNVGRIHEQRGRQMQLNSPDRCPHKYTADGWCLLCATEKAA
ncbi:hypothetical protein KPL76_06275 [Subtercola sp. PAMC28395]|uniref:hypothetical protein n=1 Tax=Subtercola sp. PAMC28395 TaxID=2846775 RepID=UPI001C0BE9DA|nr:hypothetical protein [Subtercola sp. PAMC28395]QWT24960.1 hypothetical protein KPL76_06275 [Subtercola sp. PAMC28395]